MIKQNFNNKVDGFSKLSKEEKITWINSAYFKDNLESDKLLKQYWNDDKGLQKIHDEFTENTISNFYLPLAIAPNFLIDGKDYTIPMAIEESSVVAAACKTAKFWRERGGFKTTILNFKKTGQVHFIFNGNKKKLFHFFKKIKPLLIEECKEINSNMAKRGGGVIDIEIIDKTIDIPNYYQLDAAFNTVDSMGANFINSILEQFAKTLKKEAILNSNFSEKEKNIEIIMSILTNYVPDCLVKAEVSCCLKELSDDKDFSGKKFAEKFIQAIKIAKTQRVRAVTHNKGIMNGVDSVIIATGNDFRAIEASVHAYASKNGSYTSLSDAEVVKDIFTFSIELPISLGTVGGITNLHPLVKWSLNLLGNPSGKDLMRIIAVAGLAQNFGAIKSLITSGIQKGHMKMHLINILNTLNANAYEKKELINYFKKHTVSYSSVEKAIKNFRNEL
ncbi:MAG: hydroxymethylglutaryl-CoA reductase, degradative [Flavobacteriales bacterium]|jgi:hydroxymethylglutaryl-CoA reductase|tara:strand:- start:4110 stop:5447 length:1338 start_codon:yes stop_codon:yes gene_type:complete